MNDLTPIKIPLAMETSAEEPRAFIIQAVYADMMVPQRSIGTFPSLLAAYLYLSEEVMDAGGFIKSLLANPQLGVASVEVRVYGTDAAYLITPDEADYVPLRFIPTINRRFN